MTEASAYTPPSRAPADIAARLEAYIARHERLARDHVDDTSDTPKIQRGFMDGLFLHIRRLEHQMRCFILFLAAELIARGLVKPQPLALRPRREADPAAPSAEIRREDRQLRLALSGQVRLNTFSITTPVVEGKPGRKPHRGKRPYTLMPDRLQPVDARHLLARYGRLSRVLLRADLLAERLAGRALTVKLSSPLIPAQAGTSFHRVDPDSRLRGNERNLDNSVGFPASDLTSDRAGAASLSSKARRNAGEQNNKPNPLYLSALHSLLAPEALWASAEELEDERSDLTSLHLMANEGLYAAGFPPGPDPRLRLPDFERWKPPRPGVCLL
ncbi:hypothetical protein [Ponticaulis sp.]|uniref:hypothetical protein n=1 Tax=Ponticaulis sp. TaxID=2020902 RepID=UPI000B6F61A8|nr:hypothetical protein [Ponticaulis sp.]MAI90881.1 hypothetical protein [Ponticaulis sp.]OUX98853.1 MAG: hypothetical protein CBB65_10590 [Hyphomonadaceae bacterium TMED5]|tara:strand:+ start:1977 stop:2963 length:987 start_codon:yes stop_codon:yes gene_type:complete